MPAIHDLFHIALKTADLPATLRFYCEVLGMAQCQRPALNFDGAWLKTPTERGGIILHLYAGEAAQQNDGTMALGTGLIDHIALRAEGFYEYRSRCEALGLPWRENVLAEMSLWQLFVFDPNGVLLELSFLAEQETGPTPAPTKTRQYRPREFDFDSRCYGQFSDR